MSRDVASGAIGGNRPFLSYDEGGWVTEPVFVYGARGGAAYGFAVNGQPEYVTPRGSRGSATVVHHHYEVSSPSMLEIANSIKREQQWQEMLNG